MTSVQLFKPLPTQRPALRHKIKGLLLERMQISFALTVVC
jgi:hypothetical protein